MIKFDERFSAEHDGRQWVLIETYMGKETKKDGKVYPAKEQTRESYYGNLSQVCRKILDLSAGEFVSSGDVSPEDLIRFFQEKTWKLEGIYRGFEL
jgi:hypothetical protein